MILGATALVAATAIGLLAARWMDGRTPSIAERPAVVGDGEIAQGAATGIAATSIAAADIAAPATPAPTNAAAAAAAEQATALAAAAPATRRSEAARASSTPRPSASPTPPATPTTTARTRPGNPIWTAVRLAEAPTLDGGLNDWTTDFLAFDAVVFGKAADFEGALDVSARTWAGWDEQALYIAVRVYDNVFSQPAGAAGRKMYLGDSLELQLDTNLEADWESDVYNGDDWQIGLSPGDFRGRAPEAWTWRPTDRNASGIELAALLLDDGYAIEAALPWALLGLDPARTEAIGWALNVSDNDLPQPVQLTMISTSPARSWTDPRTFGTLVIGR
jgi:hypothetical protein